MLKVMNSIERISPLIPKYKQQLRFLEEREKLFNQNLRENTSTDSQMSTNASVDSSSSSPVDLQTTNQSLVVPVRSRDTSVVDIDQGLHFPDIYTIPPLPNELTKDIEAGILRNFGPHFHGRQILIDTVAYDLIQNYNLL